MRFVSWNVNGLRAAIRKGIDAYFEDLNADVMMLQETRTLEEQLPKGWSWPSGWQVTLHPAEKKGYSGVSTGTTIPHTVVQTGKGGDLDPSDLEGRVLVTEVNGVVCINTYLPSGSNKDERQQFKEGWMEEWRTFIRPYLDDERPVVVCGDLNIAHTEDDIWTQRVTPRVQASFLTNEPGSPTYSRKVGLMLSAPRLDPVKRCIRGGPIEVKHGPKTEAGESIIFCSIRWQQPRWRTVPSCDRAASMCPTTHRLFST